MSFMIWYQVEVADLKPAGGLLEAAGSLIGLGLPLRVSNDVLGAGFVLDADVTVTMSEGAGADSFEITLMDLPATTIALLQSRHAASGLSATVHLGYFDEPATRTGSRPVVSGTVTRIDPGSDDGGRSRTVITGQETAGYLLRTTPVEKSAGDPVPTLDFVRSILPDGVDLAAGSTIPGVMRDFTTVAGSVCEAVAKLAGRAGVAMVIRDGAVHLGAAVGRDPAPVVLDPSTNIVRRVDGQGEAPTAARPKPAAATPPDRKVLTSLQIISLGHPDLRVGQVVTVTGLDGLPTGPLRIVNLAHRFATSANQRGAGYTCDLLLVAVAAGEPVAAAAGVGVQRVVDNLQNVVARHGSDHPAIDVGVVTSYQSGADQKHRASLRYGLKDAPDQVAPSVAAPVRDDAPELIGKPLASPFAFHKCGLVLPVYPGMRGLLAHNAGLVNDAVVSGWLWGEQPAHQPPANKPGDYWLALPTKIGGDGLPTGPGANDLIDATGRRVVQVAALHVSVGTPALPPVGSRPDPIPDENTITIEHHSGTTILVDSGGAVTIKTASAKLALTNGQVTLTLDGAKVQVS